MSKFTDPMSDELPRDQDDQKDREERERCIELGRKAFVASQPNSVGDPENDLLANDERVTINNVIQWSRGWFGAQETKTADDERAEEILELQGRIEDLNFELRALLAQGVTR